MTATRGVEARRQGGAGDRGRSPPARERSPAAGWLALSLQTDAGVVTPARVGYFTERVRGLGGVGSAVTDAGGSQFASGPFPATGVVAHEAVHAAQFAAAEAGAPLAARPALEAEAAAGAAALAAGEPFSPRLGAPAGMLLAWDPPGESSTTPASPGGTATGQAAPPAAGPHEELGGCRIVPPLRDPVCEIAELPPLPPAPQGVEVTADERTLVRQMLYLDSLRALQTQALRARKARERNERAAFGTGPGMGIAPALTFGARRQWNPAAAIAGRSGYFAAEQRANDLFAEGLNLVGLRTEAEIAEIQPRFIEMFGRKAMAVARLLLDKSEEEATAERSRYQAPESDPGVLDRLRAAARDIAGAQLALVQMMEHVVQTSTHYIQGPPGRLDPADAERLVFQGDQFAGHSGVRFMYERFEARRREKAREFPVLASEGLDYVRLAELPDDRLQGTLVHKSQTVLDAITTAREQLDSENVWELDPVMQHTLAQLGAGPDTPAARAVREHRQRLDQERMWVDLFLAAAAIGLTIAAVVASGGLSLVALAVEGAAMAGVAGVGVIQAYRTYDDYRLQAAARESAFDRAQAIGSEDPSLFWLALDIALALVDITQAGLAFRRLIPAARSIVALRAAAAAGESVDSAAALARLRVTAEALGHGDDFVERIMRGAQELVAGQGDRASRELAVQAAMLNPHGPVFPALVSGDRRALQNLLAEHGSWERLQGFLNAARLDETARGSSQVAREYDRIGQNLVLYRNEVMSEVQRRFGARPLGTASAQRVSDVDVSTFGVQAGADLIAAERHMFARFGANWSSALRMNFYTDASRLAMYALDELAVGGLQATRRLPALLRGMPQADAARLLQEVAQHAQVFSSARQLRFARETPDLAQRILASVSPDLRPRVQALAALDEGAELARRNQLLRQQDAIMQRLLAASDADRPAVIRELTLNQIELNFHTVEATIAPGALRQIAVPGATLAGWEAASAAESHFADALHILAESGGSRARAAGRYELYKYMRRFTQAARGAGEGADPRLAQLEQLAEPIARRGGDRTIPEGMSEAQRLAAFDLFEGYYFDAMPRMRAHAAAHPHEWGTTGAIATAGGEALEALPTARRNVPVPNVRVPDRGDDDEE